MTMSTAPATPVADGQHQTLKVGLVSVSDRASSGVYVDQGIPALTAWLQQAITSPFLIESCLIADEQPLIEAALIELCDLHRCDLIITTGGTGPARRDVTPEATRNAGTREMPGFGEQMRQISLAFVSTAILSRQIAVIRDTGSHAALIMNLPGQPKAIRQTLEGLRHATGPEAGSIRLPGIFAAVPYCIDLIGGPYIETDPAICDAFRPASAKK